ncbi:signal transduction histidine kinase [Ureibacillus xyleni]|uniref:histidine kinase n=1 Tax=Ureibacillus xyleni TaxID=614648 RepID=A0A285SCS5_9BACL|nr:sensor histidine kinase [Ureibacillus xyleni]SOC03423.1 signal transduction histidine kinase [Ureibacillus xyleni]
MKRNTFVAFSCFLGLLFFCFLPNTNVYGATIKATNGVLDLSNSKISKHKLSGQWEFYWNELIPPKALKKRVSPKIYTPIPHQWKDVIHNGQKLSSFGYATYRLQIILPDNEVGTVKAISLPNIASNYKVWVNGELMAEAGQVGVTEKTSIPANSSILFSFVPHEKTIELVLHVSNFSQRKSGIWSYIEFGNQQEIINKSLNYSIINGFLVGSLLIIGVYHFVMYLFRTKEILNLFFSMTCIALVFRILFLEGNMSSLVFPNAPWEIKQKVEYISSFISMTFFNYYLHYFLGFKLRTIYLKGVCIFHILLSLFVLLTPGKISTLILPYYSVVLIIIFFNLVLLSSYVLRTKDRTYQFNFIAISIFFIFIVNDVLYYLNFIQSVDLVPIGLLLYIFLQAILLSIRISKSFNHEEQLKEELTKINSNLETEVENRTKEIVQINNQLQHALNARLDLISSISHEMRSPLTTIKSYTKGIIDGIINDEYKKHSKTIYEETIFMERMLDDLFELSLLELEQYKFYFELVEPVPYFKKLFQKYHYEVTQSKLDFKLEVRTNKQVQINIDTIRMEQVFINLIRNALKNTNEGSITVEINCDFDFVSVSIIDTGVGIDPQMIPAIFTKFIKMNNEKNMKSSGIGLSICKEIVKTHGGEMNVTSSLGHGSNFTFTIPAIHTLSCEDKQTILEHA